MSTPTAAAVCKSERFFAIAAAFVKLSEAISSAERFERLSANKI